MLHIAHRRKTLAFRTAVKGWGLKADIHVRGRPLHSVIVDALFAMMASKV